MAGYIPKAERLYGILREELDTSTWYAGQLYYSENQLCSKYNVSRQTVRQAMALLREQNLIVSKQGSGTFVTPEAVQNRNIKSRTIGVLVTYVTDYIFPHIIKEAEKVFSSYGFKVQLASTQNSIAKERQMLSDLMLQKVDGIILEPTKSALPNPNLDVYLAVQDQHIPVICINSGYPTLDFPIVALDDEAAGWLATSYLLDNGHTRIGAILKSDDMQGHLRYQGYQRAIFERDYQFIDSDVFWYTTEDMEDFDENYERLIARTCNCSAILCYNDQIALKMLAMCENSGIKVPDELSLISVDDSLLAAITHPGVTSVHNPVTNLGRIAATNLLKLINGENINANHLFKPRLTVRDSVAKYKPSIKVPGS